MIFGRNQDIYDTRLLNTLKGSSEAAMGLLLFMERWNTFMNAVWVMATIKASFPFFTVSHINLKSCEVSILRPSVRQF